MTEIKLKPTDKKLLAHLYYNSREPATKIAKALNISREQVSYRIKKFEREGIVQGYIPLVSYSKLGFHLITIIFFKLNKPEHIKKFIHNLSKTKYNTHSIELLSKYDLAGMFIFKNDEQRNNCISEILENNNKILSDFTVIEPFLAEYYPLKFLGIKKTQPQIFHEYSQKEYSLDEKEKKILRVLNKNANSRIIDIARKTNMSAELILHKLRKLQKQEILFSTRAYFDMQKAGFFYSFIFIHLHNFSKINQDKLRSFAKNSNYVDSCMLMLGKPNCYMQIVHKDMHELHNFLNKFNDEFKEENISIELIPLKNENPTNVNILPFL